MYFKSHPKSCLVITLPEVVMDFSLEKMKLSELLVSDIEKDNPPPPLMISYFLTPRIMPIVVFVYILSMCKANTPRVEAIKSSKYVFFSLLMMVNNHL